MTFRIPVAALAAIALLALPTPATAASSRDSVVREFKGTVASVNPGGKAFRLRRPGRATVVVRVSRRTKVAKGAKPRKGRAVIVKARRDRKGWLARSVRSVPVASDDDELSSDEPLDEPVEHEDSEEESDPGLDLDDFGDPLDDGDEEPE